ncbi:2-oxo-hept-4-ene-1,7-dioate hydratase [Sagittula salina]|uniref:2-oxo-hepta-3-ene-1,7-dioic acid hydratase n=1 Tax=Sagittula salina TaxID=2820268 RepID=A0A940MGG4_9RHOB|nr:2-oxo-hepta-3-ene-1,7-dioic acid hydratase [Sagittula salina]MBP0481255.1 2-oxo-hepta-3-ene-1,7-dioic acid hydratase [Sagittula salina]
MTEEEIHAAARALIEAEGSRSQIGLLSLQHPKMSMDDAYAVQAAGMAARLVAGRKVIGWKIGLTSKAMQDALKIDTPDSGVLFDDMAFESGGTVPEARFIQPRVEAEIAFVMKAPLEGRVTREQVIEATDYVCPALEILDTRIRRTDPGTGRGRVITDTIADNAANAGIVLGQAQHNPRLIDLRWVGAILGRDGAVEETGLGAGVLNDPVMGIVWLAERMAVYGQAIRPGQVILSGSFIRPVECPPGSHVQADFGSFGAVEISFA